MTLFITTPRRRYEISDIYVMALTFCLVLTIGKIVKATLKKHENSKSITMPNPKGGNLEVEFELADRTELALTILSCINDNERYLVKNQKIRELIFRLVKEKITSTSLLMTPNMIRFLAVNLMTEDEHLLMVLGRKIISASQRVLLLKRVLVTAVVTGVGLAFSIIPYSIFIAILYFDTTENCGYKCHDYFEHIPKDEPIYVKKSIGNLVIGENNNAKQIEIYIPSKGRDKVTITNDEKSIVTQNYIKSREKLKAIEFSDFKKKNAVFSYFDSDLKDPHVPQKSCPLNQAQNNDDFLIE